jgi:hypothetical protein
MKVNKAFVQYVECKRSFPTSSIVSSGRYQLLSEKRGANVKLSLLKRLSHCRIPESVVVEGWTTLRLRYKTLHDIVCDSWRGGHIEYWVYSTLDYLINYIVFLALDFWVLEYPIVQLYLEISIYQKKKPVLRIFRNRRKDVLLWTSLQYCSVSIKPNLSLHIYSISSRAVL